MTTKQRFSLANEGHLNVLLGLLVHQGAMCPKCGYGTRVTSKRWAKCKKCGDRVERRALPTTKPRRAADSAERREDDAHG